MSLNKDVRECLRMHVSLTQHLDKDNPFRFSLATPKEISRAMTRLVDPGPSGVVPTGKRIIQDVDQIDYAMHEIFKAMGKVVPGLATRTGHRQHVDRRQSADLNEAIIQPIKYKNLNFMVMLSWLRKKKKILLRYYLIIVPVLLKEKTTCSLVNKHQLKN